MAGQQAYQSVHTDLFLYYPCFIMLYYIDIVVRGVEEIYLVWSEYVQQTPCFIFTVVTKKAVQPVSSIGTSIGITKYFCSI